MNPAMKPQVIPFRPSSSDSLTEPGSRPAPLARPVFVALEGLDGCGKSTVARRLADRMGAELLKTPPAELDDIRHRLDDLLEGCPLARPLFYASMNAWVSDRARSNLAAGRSTVVDRYWLSTLAYGTARQDSFPMMGIEPGLLVPTATFFLAAGPQVRRQRMDARHRISAEDLRSTQPDFESALLKAYLDHGRRWCRGAWWILDAGSETPDDLVMGIDQRLREVTR